MKTLLSSAALVGALALSTPAVADTVSIQFGDDDCFGGLGGNAPAVCDSSAVLPASINTTVLPTIIAITGQDFSTVLDPAGHDIIDHNGDYTAQFDIDLTGKTVTAASVAFRTASLEVTNTTATPGEAEFLFGGVSIGTYQGSATDIEDHSFDVTASFSGAAGVVSRLLEIRPDSSRANDATPVVDAWGLDFARLTLEIEDAVPGGGGGGGGPTTVVPIPAGGLLLASAIGLLGFQRSRKA